jgi:hypothetical protein
VEGDRVRLEGECVFYLEGEVVLPDALLNFKDE